jgi:hypothetical protein
MQNWHLGIEIKQYTPEHKSKWDRYVTTAKNGHFFFQRTYMEYHRERFFDFSLMFYSHGRLVAVFPANVASQTVYSHQGLTYGGVLCDDAMTTPLMLAIFQALLSFLRQEGMTRLIYKVMPYIYFQQPAEEDRYALFANGAKLVRRDVSSVLDLLKRRKYTKGKKENIAKAKKAGLEVKRSADYVQFMGILRDVLQSRHCAKATHSTEEIAFLAGVFSENIKLFCAFKNDHMLAGALLFENDNVIHAQYLANSDAGREIGALDLIIDHLIETCGHKQYLSFGISNEDEGRRLNLGLLSSKEAFGASTVVHDLYELDLEIWSADDSLSSRKQ